MKILALIPILALACVVGCQKHIAYELTHPDGTREMFNFDNVGFDVKAGKIGIEKDGQKVSVSIENLDSQAKAMELAGRAVDVLSKVAK